MGKVIDLTGQQFGRLTVIKQDFDYPIEHNIKGNKAYWLCKCSCGKTKTIRGQDLRQGKVISCGCFAKECASQNTTPNMIGQKFGKLTVLKRVGSKNNRSLWLCQCNCGRQVEVTRDSLISGNTQSCGCILSNGENIISDILTKHHINFLQQYTFSDLLGKNNTKLRFDFGILNQDGTLKCLIEFQGEQHFIPFKNDTPEKFSLRQEYDQRKRDYCINHNIPLIEINYQDRTNLNWEFLSNLISF